MTSPLSPNAVTYRHLIAGSVMHLQVPKAHKDDMPNPVKTITFHGKKGGIGFYSTDDAEEIKQLDAVANNPQTQLEKVAAPLDVVVAAAEETATINKPGDPAIQQAVAEVTQQAVTASDPAVISAQAKLADMIAASKGQG